jgi:hypothetical protein
VSTNLPKFAIVIPFSVKMENEISGSAEAAHFRNSAAKVDFQAQNAFPFPKRRNSILHSKQKTLLSRQIPTFFLMNM